MTRRIVVTGGAGFIGSHLVDDLLSSGYHVTVFDAFGRRGSEYNAAWLRDHHPGDRFTVVRGDVRDADHVCSVVRSADVIYHVAGQVAVTLSVDDPRADFETNALGAFNVLEGARRSGRRPAVIFTSTNKVYGRMDDLATVEEERRYRYLARFASRSIVLTRRRVKYSTSAAVLPTRCRCGVSLEGYSRTSRGRDSRPASVNGDRVTSRAT